MPLWRFLFFLGALLMHFQVAGQEDSSSEGSLLPESDDASKLAARLRLNWETEGVASAIENGFLNVAATLSDRILEQSDIPPLVRAQLLEDRLHIALIKGDMEMAAQALEAIEELGMQADPLAEAFFTFYQGDVLLAEALLKGIEVDRLDAADLAWTYLLEGLILSRSGEIEAAFSKLQLAEATAPSALLREQFELIRFREELAQGSSDDTTVSALRESVRSMSGERSGFEAARLLAIALHNAGETTEAIDFLSSQLALPGLREFGLRSDFLLLLGMLSGSESTRGGLALREIVASSGDPEQQAVALTLLAQSLGSGSDAERFLLDIEDWLAGDPPHPLADRMLAYQSYFHALAGDFSAAEESSRALVARYPASPYLGNALRMLAFTSWNQSPSRYRTAADYLNQLRQRSPDATDSIEIGALIADCYFLNEDFASASDAYGAVFKDAPPEMASSIFYQRILAEIAAGRPGSAAGLIDEGRSDSRLGDDAIWKAEWNLLDYLRKQGRTDEAFERIEQVLRPGAGVPSSVSSDLSLRFRWLEARLTLEAGPSSEAVEKASILLGELSGGEYEQLPEALRNEVESHLLLLQGEAELASGGKEAGLKTFSLLREQYPDSGPTILSYLVESRNESNSDNLVNAQQSLVALVDRFPESQYAPIALWEAALNAEQRGLNIHLQEAIGILERLVSGYPSHELVYYARLKQGDLARRLNDFPTALLLYERLLALFPNHPERFRAEMSRGDCLMAIGSTDPDRFDQAAVIYERNCLLPAIPLPVRVESGFKWAHSLRQQGDVEGAEAVYWLIFERFVEDPDLSQALLQEDAGRYWLARSLLELGSLQAGKGELTAARRIYTTLIQMNLPGKGLAQSRLESLS